MSYRVIVADDEDVIRKGIVQLVDWEKLGCQVVKECSNGLQVLEYLKKNPAEIVITDIKMPKMTGIELMKAIGETYQKVQVVVLTAYSDFDYAQKALRYGAVDFVVKNDFITDLPKAVEAAVKRSEEAKAQDELNEEEYRNIQGYILETLALTRTLNDPEDISRFGLDQKYYCVCSCEITGSEYQAEPDNTVQMLKNFLSGIEKTHPYYIVNIHETGMAFIISSAKDIGLSLQEITSLCGEILRIVEEFMRIDIKFGISSVIDDVHQLPKAFQESVTALSRSAKSGNEIILYVEDPPAGNTANLNLYSAKVVECLFTQPVAEAETYLENMKQEIIDTHYPFDKAKIKAINLCAAVFGKFGEAYVHDEVEQMENDVYSQINQSTTLYSLFQTCSETIRKLDHMASGGMEKHYLIGQIDRFIRANYQRNLTLQEIADQIHISSAYVSRLYRNKTGITVTEAINQIRIDHAKLLLENPVYKVYEIAGMVGFEDAAYFTNVFTKYVGCSPSEYRNRK